MFPQQTRTIVYLKSDLNISYMFPQQTRTIVYLKSDLNISYNIDVPSAN